MAANVALLQAMNAALAAQSQPAQAGAMQAYMKSTMPFLGIAAPQRRKVVAEVAAAYPVTDSQTLIDTVLQQWRSATHREQRYAALDLLRVPRLRKFLDLQCLPAVHEMLLSGPWWDHNDEISGQVLPVLLQRHPTEMKAALRNWARSDSPWLRRAAMLSQRSLKTGFDAVLLYDCILPSLGDSALAKEFFIRKGMGWALRERSYAAPEEVQAFCAEYKAQLSPLTVREALKAIRRRSD
ncbi:MAG: DNA alkylation repair protein [Rubrivivax sp.]|nr:DNA alkylation repair protein [Rubrivivax sp.]